MFSPFAQAMLGAPPDGRAELPQVPAQPMMPPPVLAPPPAAPNPQFAPPGLVLNPEHLKLLEKRGVVSPKAAQAVRAQMGLPPSAPAPSQATGAPPPKTKLSPEDELRVQAIMGLANRLVWKPRGEMWDAQTRFSELPPGIQEMIRGLSPELTKQGLEPVGWGGVAGLPLYEKAVLAELVMHERRAREANMLKNPEYRKKLKAAGALEEGE